MSLRALLMLVIATVGAGCPASSPMQVPPGEPAIIATTPPASPNESRPSPAAFQAAAGKQDDGMPCFAADECTSGICEGASCDRTQPGACIATDAVRNCAADQVSFCGCDGQSFVASSTCPGEPFLHQGRCEGGD